ncbi:MAG TPA: cupin domain-containing protein [Candidatus Thermoplasmatota archaeon]|nr:cupin domain-containing protein [Candidatus Thermoplasmatota archaeon]
MPSVSHYASAPPFTTKDGSTIRELLHPSTHGNRHQSLAEARVAPGKRTTLHYHRVSEEIYHIVSGHGLMRLGDDQFEMGPGDTIAIAPGVPHAIANVGRDELVFLCCCSPGYSDEDTVLLG